MKAFFLLLFASVSVFGATRTIIIEGTQFKPGNLVVHQGDKVVWTNKDFFPHTATSLDKTFNSKSIPVEKSWTWIANKKGDHAYKCLFHPTMKGHLIVN